MIGPEEEHHDWDPLTLDQAREVFGGAPFRWWVCGGIALELYAGRSWRSHGDLDIGIVRAEARDVWSWLADRDLWVAARGTLSPWRGDTPRQDRGENNVWARDDPGSPWRFDLNVGSGDGDAWAYRRDERVRLDWDAAVMRADDGLPHLAPELQLLFKSKSPRPKDDVDAQHVIPLLEDDRLGFLADHLDHDHPWRRLMTRRR